MVTLVEKLSGLLGVSRVVEMPKRELWRGGGANTAAPRVLRRLWAMGLDYPWRFGMAAVAAAVAAFLQLKIPQFVGQAVDAAVGLLAATETHAAAQSALLTAGGLVLAAGTLRGLFTMLQNYQGEAIGQLIGYRLRQGFYDKLQHLSFSFHDRVHTGELISRGMLDIEGVRPFIDQGILKVLVLVMLLSFGVVRLTSIDMALGLLALSFVPFVAWRAVVTRLTMRRTWLALQERLGDLARVMEENLGGIRVVRAFMAQDHEMKVFDTASDAAQRLAAQRVSIRFANTSLMTYAFFVAMGLVLWRGGIASLDGRITVGQLTEFLAFMAVLQVPVRQVGMMVNAVARASTSGARVFEVLDMVPAVRDKPGAQPLQLTNGELQFDNVSFGYQLADGSAGAPVLRGISFTVKRGQTLGIVGPPGSGKSTIAHLCARYYDVDSGKITIDGQDIRDVTLRSLRSTVGVVQQEAFLFTAAIENNVAYGDPWAERPQISGATEAAQLRRYIEQLPQGYGEIVGERGVSLSGGQRQRLSIARSVMLPASIMAFDDSTAAVDTATEHQIREAMAEMADGRATIIVAHRLSSLMHADEILFLDHGQIIERGDHASLMALGGHYADLYRLQNSFGNSGADGTVAPMDARQAANIGART